MCRWAISPTITIRRTIITATTATASTGSTPGTQLITGLVALLTGQGYGVGQMLPASYGVYNVPIGLSVDLL